MTRHHWKARAKRGLVKVRKRVPPGLRLVLGLLLIVGGVFGFLPILGFWMIPLGVAVVALDIKPLWHRLRRTLASQGNGESGGSDHT